MTDAPLGLSGPQIELWRSIALEQGNAFLLPEWYAIWMRHYGQDAEPIIVEATDERGETTGLMPLVLEGRRLRFAGASLGDHFGPVSRAGAESEVATAAAAEMQRGRYLVLDHIDRGAGWPGAVTSSAGRPLGQSSSRLDVLPYLDLRELTWEDYLAARSRNFRSQVRRKMKRLEVEHGATYRRTREESELDRDFDSFFRLHDARWRDRGGSSVASARARAFHLDFARELLGRGWLRLWFLEIEGRAVAAWYGWNVGGRYAYYLGGFDPEWEAQSVGFSLLAHTIREATEEGAREYDFLRGGEEYKARFAAEPREVETVVLAPAGNLAGIAASAEGMIWRMSRRLPAGVRMAGRRAYGRISRRTPTGNDR